MRNFLFLILALSLFFGGGGGLIAFAEDETLTITTYYPSPHGVYKNLTSQQMKIGKDYQWPEIIAPADGLIVEGKVGIGMFNPTVSLDVVGNINASGDIVTTAGIILGGVKKTE